MFGKHFFEKKNIFPKKKQNIENWGESHRKIVSFAVRRRYQSARRRPQNFSFTLVVSISERF